MNKQRKRKKGNSARRKEQPKRPPAKPSTTKFQAIIASGAIILCAAIWILSGISAPNVPSLDSSELDESSAEFLQEYISKVESDKDSGTAWGQLGGLLHLFLYKEEADFCLREAARLEPANPRWPHLLGRLLESDSPQSAVEAYRAAVNLCGSSPEAPRMRLSKLLLESGKKEAAQKELNALTKANPSYTPAKLALAQLAQTTPDWTNAIPLLEDCTEDPTTAKAAYALLSNLYQRMNEPRRGNMMQSMSEQAAADTPWPDPFAEEIRLLRTDFQSLYDLAQEYLMARKPDKATQAVTQLAEKFPERAETWLMVGRHQQLIRKPVEAEKSFRHHLELDPTSINGNFQLGTSLLHQKKYDEALKVFQHTTTLKESFGPAYYNMGMALVRLQRREDAVVSFKKAIEYNPEQIGTYLLLGDLYLQLGQRTNAIALARQAEQIDASNQRLQYLWNKINRLSETPPPAGELPK